MPQHYHSVTKRFLKAAQDSRVSAEVEGARSWAGGEGKSSEGELAQVPLVGASGHRGWLKLCGSIQNVLTPG